MGMTRIHADGQRQDWFDHDHAAEIDTDRTPPAVTRRLVLLSDRPLLVRMYRRACIALLRWMERCVREEREAYIAAGVPLGAEYLRNSFAKEAELAIRQITLETT